MGLLSKVFGSLTPNPNVKTFELWLEGEPSKMQRAEKIAVIKGENFNEAVKNYLDQLMHPQVSMWHFDHMASQWRFYSRKVFDNEKDARVKFG